MHEAMSQTPDCRRHTMHRVVAFAIVLALAPGVTRGLEAPRQADAEARAEQTLRRAMDVVRDARERGVAIAAGDAPRPGTEGLEAPRAALIGAELTPLMTTLGSLESKRLATDPAWAPAIVRQLAAHGIRSNDIVLASFSGSFPGLNLAVMAACTAMDVRLVAVSSVTASTWGANEPGFTWPEIEALVSRAGVMPAASVAITLGGTRDAARDLSDEGRALARGIQADAAKALGARVLATVTLTEAIDVRMQVYRSVLGDAHPAAYINVGGNHASLGGEAATFRREEGWLSNEATVTRADPRASVTEAWLAQGVPVMNLLDVKALARAWGVGSTR